MSDFKEAPSYHSGLRAIGELVNPVSFVYEADKPLGQNSLNYAVPKVNAKEIKLVDLVCANCQLKSQKICTGLIKDENGITTGDKVRYKATLKRVGWPKQDSSWVVNYDKGQGRFIKRPASRGVRITGYSEENKNLGTSLCSPTEPVEIR